MRHVSTFITLLCALWLPPAAAEPPLGSDLDGLLTYAREHNPELAAARYEAEAARQLGDSADTLADPVLRIEPMDVTNGTPETKFTLMQRLPWFGTRDLRREAATAQAAMAAGREAATHADLSARLRQAHVMRYTAAANERLTLQARELLQRLEQVAQTRYANGLGSQQDVLRAQIELTDADTELLAWQNTAHHAHVEVNALLARAADAPLAEARVLPAVPPAAALDEAALLERLERDNPQLRIAGADITAAEKSRELAYAARYPELTLGVSPTRSNGAVDRWDLMLELDIPLQQSARRTQERSAEAQLAAANARRAAERDAQRAELVRMLAELETARRTESLVAHRLLPQAELGYRAALAAYEAGRADFELLITAHRQWLRAQQQQLKAQADMQSRLADIENLLGGSL
jgi:outer membrane protein TolC